ncbi:hypothetical protein HDU82_003578 [Entophlyctis luteolus]|nr:hypothetical protein HDU82_003578 [Entophlyctis luteolus]
MRYYFEDIKRLAAETLQNLVRLSHSSNRGIDPIQELQNFSFKAICAFMVGSNAKQRQKLEQLYLTFHTYSVGFEASFMPGWISFFMGGAIKKGLSARGKIADVVLKMIAERRCSENFSSQKDAMLFFLESRDEGGEPMSDDEIVTMFLIMLLAGFDTASKQLTIMFYQLTGSVVADDFELLTEEVSRPDILDSDRTVCSVPSLEAFVKESMRVFAVAPFVPRLMANDFIINGTKVKAGTMLWPNRETCRFLASGPDDFRLSNFLGPDSFEKFYSGEYSPFGSGDRMCLGMQLAKLEMKIMVASLLRDYRITRTTIGKITHFPVCAVNARYQFSEKMEG